jgi:hypothetical protein
MNANPVDTTRPPYHTFSALPVATFLLDLEIRFCLKPLKYWKLLRQPFLESSFVLLGALRIRRRRPLCHDPRNLYYEEPRPRFDMPLQPSILTLFREFPILIL